LDFGTLKFVCEGAASITEIFDRGTGKFRLRFAAAMPAKLFRMRKLPTLWMVAIALSFGLARTPVAWGHADLLALIDLVAKQIEANPKSAVLYWRRGELYRLHLDWKLAESDYDRAAQLDPKLAAVDLARGKMWFESGQNDRAKVELDKFLDGQPNQVDALTTRARVLVKLGQRKAAVADFTRAIEQMPKPMPEYFVERAQAQAEEGEKEAALRGLNEGVKLFGASMTLQLYAIDLELALKHFDEALSRLEAISNRSERKEKWLARRGEILVLASRPGEAQKAFDASLVAIQSLPPRLQQTPAMLDLKKNVSAALESVTAKK
jgi:tetratricopeptide (TPR) repeat protein